MKLFMAAVSSVVPLMMLAPAAEACPLIVVNVIRYEITNVSVNQANYAPNNMNGDVTVNVTNKMLAPKIGVGLGRSVPVRSTRGQVR